MDGQTAANSQIQRAAPPEPACTTNGPCFCRRFVLWLADTLRGLTFNSARSSSSRSSLSRLSVFGSGGVTGAGWMAARPLARRTGVGERARSIWRVEAADPDWLFVSLFRCLFGFGCLFFFFFAFLVFYRGTRQSVALAMFVVNICRRFIIVDVCRKCFIVNQVVGDVYWRKVRGGRPCADEAALSWSYARPSLFLLPAGFGFLCDF